MNLMISPLKLLQTEVKNFTDVFKSESPTIVTCKIELGEIKIAAALTILVNDLVNFFSVGKTIGGGSVADTVKLILKKFFYLKLEDIKFCFEKMKFGEYGKTYDRIDGNIILETLNIYANDRADAAEASQQDADKIEIPAIPGAVKIFSEVRKELEKGENKHKKYEKFKKEYEANKNKKD